MMNKLLFSATLTLLVVSCKPKENLVGDVLFKGSIGRTDLPRGNHNDLLSSIKNKLWPLGNEITFISGHGPTSTFGDERINNMFVSDAALSS